MSSKELPRNENIKVFIRVKPKSLDEKSIDLTIAEENTISIGKKVFRFNRIFDGNASQLQIYKNVASGITEGAFEGYNGTIFAYGQSGTGKTHTILGKSKQDREKGIIPNVFAHIFAQISLSNKERTYLVTVTFLEIYNEEVRDLLNNSNEKLEIRENPERGVYVKNLTGYTVESLDQVMKIIEKGNKKRSTGSTKLNDVSSRSHAIFTVTIEAKNHGISETTCGKLHLVDLAGSERVSKSFACGDRLREAGKINLSLSVLGNVISALIDGRTDHIPYRNSKLTRLLQDSLGGNSRTSMIATISSDEKHYDETLYTLMYAERVKRVTNHVKKNEENVSVLKTFEAKIIELQSKLQQLQCREVKKQSKKRVKQALYERDVEISLVEKNKRLLMEQIEAIQKKILIGGENLVEKAQLQLEMLENHENEIKHLDSCHTLLQEVLNSKGEEKIAIEQQCLTLEEEDKLLDQQIHEMEKKMTKSEKVLLKKEQEYQNEISNLLYTNKCLAKDLSLASFVIEKALPKEYLNKIRENVVFDEETRDFRLKYVHLAGNHNTILDENDRKYHEFDDMYKNYKTK